MAYRCNNCVLWSLRLIKNQSNKTVGTLPTWLFRPRKARLSGTPLSGLFCVVELVLIQWTQGTVWRFYQNQNSGCYWSSRWCCWRCNPAASDCIIIWMVPGMIRRIRLTNCQPLSRKWNQQIPSIAFLDQLPGFVKSGLVTGADKQDNRIRFTLQVFSEKKTGGKYHKQHHCQKNCRQEAQDHLQGRLCPITVLMLLTNQNARIHIYAPVLTFHVP